MLVAKLLFNSIISPVGEKFMTMDISIFIKWHHSSVHNSFASTFTPYLTKSSTNTISKQRWHQMVPSIFARIAGYTDYLKAGFYPMSSSKNNWISKVIDKASWSWPMEALFSLSAIYIGHGKFRSQIRWRGACPPSQANTRKWLFYNYRMGEKTLHQNHIGLGLQATSGPFFNARLC